MEKIGRYAFFECHSVLYVKEIEYAKLFGEIAAAAVFDDVRFAGHGD